MPTLIDTNKYSDGASVTVPVTHAVLAEETVYAGGWLGIAARYAESGDNVALTITTEEFNFTVPTALAVDAGDTVFVDLSQILDHHIPDAALSKTSGTGKVRLFRATSDQDANDIVSGIFLGGLGLS